VGETIGLIVETEAEIAAARPALLVFFGPLPLRHPSKRLAAATGPVNRAA